MTTQYESARDRLNFLLSQSIPDDVEVADIADELQEQIPTTPDVHEATRKLLEQVVELARRPIDVSGIAAPQVNVQPANVHIPAPNVTVQAPNVTVQAQAPASAIPWTFEFERFPNGTIKAIHATPKLKQE